MKLKKRLLSLLLALAMVCAVMPVGLRATAEETPAEPDSGAVTIPDEANTDDAQADAVDTTIPTIGEKLTLEPWVNPLYADVLDVEDLPEYEAPEKPDASVQATFLPREEAVGKVQNYMKNRTETFTFYVLDRDGDYNALLTDILNAAMVHTGVPTQGDYLLWHVMGMADGEVAREHTGEGYNYTYTITLVYSTTREQELTMNAEVATLLNRLNVWDKTDYEKAKAVYDYICENVTYDFEHLEDAEYYLQFSAYAALVNKTAVCQGYALLFYRLMLELGVDCRVITGIGGDDQSGYGPHAWNIVAVDGLYYNVDSTWDAGYDEYWWFLNNTWNFVGHYRAVDYETVEFHTAYPMAAEDYDPDVPGEVDPVMNYGYCGDNAIWILSREGELVITGTGAMYDYVYHTTKPDMPYWSDMYESFITSVYVDEGITYIGDHSFYELSNVTEVVLPDSLLGIGKCAFMYCASLTSVIIPENVTEIEASTFSGCESLASVTLPDGLTGIGAEAFYQCGSLTEITLPEGVTTIGERVFARCFGLTSIRIPDGVSSIPREAFNDCAALISVILPDGITSIAFWAFHECNSLVEINLPDSVTTIGNGAFHGCDALKTITMPDSLITIDELAFSYSGLTEIVFLGDAPSVGRYCFAGVTATAYYPANNDTWTEEVMQDYEGDITWVCSCAHEYTSVVTAPTCASQGYTTHTCSICGDSYQDDYTEMLPHTPGEEVTENIVDPTCSAKGSYDRVIYCTVCGDELERVTEEMEPLPHAYESVVTEPTCTNRGFTTHTCVECGDSYEDSFVEAPGHVFTDGICTVCGSPERLLGDVNDDGEIDILDANLIVTYYNELRDLDEEQLLAADVNGDGEVDIMDANLIVAYYNEVIDAFPAEKE